MRGLDRARPWAERYDHSTWIDSVLEAQRRGQGPPRRVDDADGDGGDDDGDFMPDHDDEYCQNLPDSTAEKMHRIPTRRPRKRASTPELLFEKSGSLRGVTVSYSVLALNAWPWSLVRLRSEAFFFDSQTVLGRP